VGFDPDSHKSGVTLADGAWASELRARGLAPAAPVELASLDHPTLVLQLAQEYLAAGARILTTNTFSANRFTLERIGERRTVAEINAAGARLARQAVEEHAGVAEALSAAGRHGGERRGARGAGRGESRRERPGSQASPAPKERGAAAVAVAGAIGPSGKILAVREIGETELADAFAEQARALAEGGVDLIVLETFSELAELLVAVGAVKAVTRMPVAASLSFDSGPQRTYTMMGAGASESATALDDAGADVIGCNCGAGITHVLPAVVALRAHTARPLWVKPSAGLPELDTGQPVYRQTADEFAALVPTLIDAGANIIGGCCGVGPEHIQRVAAVLEHRRAARRAAT
jgi:methionine synthase I (cobalamin-dependent)